MPKLIDEWVEQREDMINRIALYSGVASATVFLVGTFLATLSYKGYDFSNQYFSELGVRDRVISPDDPTLVRVKAPVPELFNVSLIITGILFIPFFVAIYFRMKDQGLQESERTRRYQRISVAILPLSTLGLVYFRQNKFFSVHPFVSQLFLLLFLIGMGFSFLIAVEDKAHFSNFFFYMAMVTGVNIGPWLALVGVFDLHLSWYGHVYFAIGLYYFIALTSVFWGIAVFTANPDHPYKQGTRWKDDITFLIVIVVLTVINIMGEDSIHSTPLVNLITPEVYQKLMAYLFIAYLGLFISRRVYRMRW